MNQLVKHQLHSKLKKSRRKRSKQFLVSLFRRLKIVPGKTLWVEKYMFWISGFVFSVVLYDLGFIQFADKSIFLQSFYSTCLIAYLILLLLKIPLLLKQHYKLWIRLITVFIFLLLVFYSLSLLYIKSNLFHNLWVFKWFHNLNSTYLIIGFIFFMEMSKNAYRFYQLNFNPALLFVLSFAFVILLGAGILMLPNSTTVGHIPFVDALFTSTSAVCVTGLVVVDTGTYYTYFGKTIVLMLIQIGGLGVMTFTSFIGYFFRKTTSFKTQVFLKDVFNVERLGDVFKTIIRITLFTLAFELMGALFIFISLGDSASFLHKVTFSLFHSISAFCNAGFSTLPNGLYQSSIVYNYGIALTISFLILFGGIGFPVIINGFSYFKYKLLIVKEKILETGKKSFNPKVILLHTRIVVVTTVALLVFGTVMFMALEWNNTLTDHDSIFGKLVVSFFNSVTPRTAGFNNVNMTSLLTPTVLIIIFLMWIGASPVSTGGGIKTTTFAINFMNMYNVAQGKDRIEMFWRKIANRTVREAFAIVMLSALVIGMGAFFISIFESNNSNIPILSIIFECFSAYGTVGLSLNATPLFSSESKIVLIILMFLGRVGTLTFLLAIITKTPCTDYMYPKESVLVY